MKCLATFSLKKKKENIEICYQQNKMRIINMQNTQKQSTEGNTI